jgi:hypothetical protein
MLVVAAISVISLGTQVVRYGLGIQNRVVNRLEKWFFVDLEAGVPAWFSAVLLFLIGERLWRIGTAARADGDRWHRHWLWLGATFVYLSLDEVIQIHELGALLTSVLDMGGAFAIAAWVVLAIPLLLVFGVLFVPFFLALPMWTRWAFVVSALVYLGGAIGFEMLGALVADRVGVINTVTTTVDGVTTSSQFLTVPSVTYAIIAGVEEALEMMGAVMFLGAVTVRLQRGALPTQVAAEDRPVASDRGRTYQPPSRTEP